MNDCLQNIENGPGYFESYSVWLMNAKKNTGNDCFLVHMTRRYAVILFSSDRIIASKNLNLGISSVNNKFPVFLETELKWVNKDYTDEYNLVAVEFTENNKKEIIDELVRLFEDGLVMSSDCDLQCSSPRNLRHDAPSNKTLVTGSF